MAIKLTKKYRDKYGPLEASALYRDDQQAEAEQAAGLPQGRAASPLAAGAQPEQAAAPQFQDIPDGAEVQRTVTRQGEDGTQQRDVFKWQNQNPEFVAPDREDPLARRMAVDDRLRFSRLTTGSNPDNRRQADDMMAQHRGSALAQADRRNAFNLAGADRNQAGQIAAMGANQAVQVAGLNREGMIGQGRDAANQNRMGAQFSATEQRKGVEATAGAQVKIEDIKSGRTPSIFSTQDSNGNDVGFVYYNGQIQRVDDRGMQLAGEALRDAEDNIVGYMGSDGKPSYFQTKQTEITNKPAINPITGLPYPQAQADAGSTGKAPPVGTERDGYRFNGGDPQNRENWSKV